MVNKVCLSACGTKFNRPGTKECYCDIPTSKYYNEATVACLSGCTGITKLNNRESFTYGYECVTNAECTALIFYKQGDYC
jgi:hypothetical protein